MSACGMQYHATECHLQGTQMNRRAPLQKTFAGIIGSLGPSEVVIGNGPHHSCPAVQSIPETEWLTCKFLVQWNETSTIVLLSRKKKHSTLCSLYMPLQEMYVYSTLFFLISYILHLILMNEHLHVLCLFFRNFYPSSE